MSSSDRTKPGPKAKKRNEPKKKSKRKPGAKQRSQQRLEERSVTKRETTRASDEAPAHEESLVARMLTPVIEAIHDQVDHSTREIDPFQRDPEFVRSILPMLKLVDWYYHTEIRGWENVPEQGPCLIVANHSGGAMPVDPFPFVVKWTEERGAEAPLYLLTYDLDFGNPLLGGRLLKMGCIPANHENARGAFDRSAPVIVFPGGDYEVFRPWTERNKIEFGGRKGFLRLALSAGVPILPMTIHGAHESTLVLTRGSDIAHATGLDKLNVKVFPFIWNVPFGPSPGFIPTVQFPSKVTIQLGEPLSWPDLGPEHADDPDALQSCYDDVTGTMQQAMDAMAEEDPYPVLTRMNELRPSKLIAKGWRRLWK